MSDIDITDWTKLGSVIRSARKSAGLTQHELAERSGTARSWIARIEAGHRKAELEQILLLLDALGLRMRLHSPAELSTHDTGSEGAAESWPSREQAQTWSAVAGKRLSERRAAQRRSWAASTRAAERLRAEGGAYLPDARDEQGP